MHLPERTALPERADHPERACEPVRATHKRHPRDAAIASGGSERRDDTTATGAPEASTDRPWRRALIASATVWLVTHVGYAILTFFAFFQSNRPVPKSLPKAFANWGNWDAEWFVWIAKYGYTGYHGKDIDEERSAAFFPLYSLLIKILSYVTVEPVIAALLIAFASQIGAFTILHRMTERELDRGTAGRTLWYLVAFPTGFYLGLTYNASLFLLLAIGSMYLMRRGTWWAAAGLGALATATRSSALLLVIPFCYEYLRQHGFRLKAVRWNAAWVAAIPTGIVCYSLYCWHIFGDPLKFMHAQALWFRERDWPWIGIYQTFRILFDTKNIFANDVRNLLDLGAVLLVGVALILGFFGPWRWRRDQWFLGIFCATSLLFIISFPSADVINRVPLLSAGRLSLEAFPAFMIAARIGRNPTFDRAFVFIGVLLQGLWFTHFLLHHFIG